MQSSSEQPLVGEERCVMTLIRAAKETKPTYAWHEVAPNTVANATKIIVLATKIQKLVGELATRTHWVLYLLP